ncbi:uncharacterized protein [Diadema antillarum]|uniref:uncharacterized protein n=1 Tax=Diadema antillarum TaxID=105358 RepID=UPI003A8C09CB
MTSMHVQDGNPFTMSLSRPKFNLEFKLESSYATYDPVGGVLAQTGSESDVTLKWGQRYTFRCLPVEDQGKYHWNESIFTWTSTNGAHRTLLVNAFPREPDVKEYLPELWDFNRTNAELVLLKADHRNTGSLTCQYGLHGYPDTERETNYSVNVVDGPLAIFCDGRSNESTPCNTATLPTGTVKVNFTCAKYGASNYSQLSLRATVTDGRGTVREVSELQNETNEDKSSSVSMKFEVAMDGKQVEVSCSLVDNGREVENAIISISRTGRDTGARRAGIVAGTTVSSFVFIAAVLVIAFLLYRKKDN